MAQAAPTPESPNDSAFPQAVDFTRFKTTDGIVEEFVAL